MSVRVACPFCKTQFDLPAVPPTRRTVCPRCGESVPITSVVESPTDPLPVQRSSPPSAPPSGRWVLLSFGLTAIILAGFAIWWFNHTPATPATTEPTKSNLPPATKPPAMLPAIKYLPRDSQIVAAVQPQQVIQYAERTGQKSSQVFEELGLPKPLREGLTDAGLPPDSIDHLAIAANATDLWFAAAVVTRKPYDDDTLREKLKAKVNADKRERATVTLGGVPLHMAFVNDRTLLFAWQEKHLDAAKKPSAGVPDLPAGVRESVNRLSPSSFVWIATDSTDWTKVKGLELAAGFAKQPELLKRLDGGRAVAAGLSFEPDLTLGVRVKMAEATRTKELVAAMTDRFREAKAAVTTSGEWAEAVIPFDPPKDALGTLRKALEK